MGNDSLKPRPENRSAPVNSSWRGPRRLPEPSRRAPVPPPETPAQPVADLVGTDSSGAAGFVRDRMPATTRRGGDGDAPAPAGLLARNSTERAHASGQSRVEPAGRALGPSPRSTNLFSFFSFGFFRGLLGFSLRSLLWGR